MEINFQGKNVLVTGAAQGIGKSICEKLAKLGATVLALDRREDQLKELEKEIPGLRPIVADLLDWNGIKKAMENIGRVDGLVNNAGVAFMNHFLEITEADFDRSFGVNVKAIIAVSQMCAKGMVERKKGSIVNVSSMSSHIGHAEHAVYCSTKSAVDGLTRVMALELGAHNVRVNCINPTTVLTEMGRFYWSEPARKDLLMARIPMGRFAEVDEIVNTICFLLSDYSSMINGVTLLVDGGHIASPHNVQNVKPNGLTSK